MLGVAKIALQTLELYMNATTSIHYCDFSWIIHFLYIQISMFFSVISFLEYCED